MTEPVPNEPLKDFHNTVQAGEARTGRVISIEDEEVLVELDGFSGPWESCGAYPSR